MRAGAGASGVPTPAGGSDTADSAVSADDSLEGGVGETRREPSIEAGRTAATTTVAAAVERPPRQPEAALHVTDGNPDATEWRSGPPPTSPASHPAPLRGDRADTESPDRAAIRVAPGWRGSEPLAARTETSHVPSHGTRQPGMGQSGESGESTSAPRNDMAGPQEPSGAPGAATLDGAPPPGGHTAPARLGRDAAYRWGADREGLAVVMPGMPGSAGGSAARDVVAPTVWPIHREPPTDTPSGPDGPIAWMDRDRYWPALGLDPRTDTGSRQTADRWPSLGAMAPATDGDRLVPWFDRDRRARLDAEQRSS